MTNAPTTQPVSQFVTADTPSVGNNTPADVSPVGPIAAPITVVPIVQAEQSKVPAAAAEAPVAISTQEGGLDKAIKWITKKLAKLLGKPDPFTGELPPAKAKPTEGQTPIQPQTLGQKVRAKANQVIEKTGTVMNKAVDVTKQAVDVTKKVATTTVSTVKQASETVKDIAKDVAEPQPSLTPIPEQPVQTQSLKTLEK